MQLVWKAKEEEKIEEVAKHEGKIGNSFCCCCLFSLHSYLYQHCVVILVAW